MALPSTEHAHVAQQVVERLYVHAPRTGHLRSRQTTNTRCIHQLQRTSHNLVGQCQHLLVSQRAAVGIVSRDVAARLPDLWQHLRRHPALEGLRRWQLRRENQCIESTLVDEHCLRLVVRTRALNQGGGFVLLVNVSCKCISAFAVPQRRRHVFSDKQRFAPLSCQRPDFSEQLILGTQKGRFRCALVISSALSYRC